MSPKTASMIRDWVLFWVCAPLVVDAFCLALGQVHGGMYVVWVFLTFFVAHVVAFAGLVGIGGMILGLRPDWKLAAATVIGLGAGLVVLSLIYLDYSLLPQPGI